MEALNSCLTTGEQSGGQEHCRPESHRRGPEPKSPSQPHQQQLPGLPKPHGTPQQPKQPRRQHPERKRLRNQRQSVDSDNASEHKQEAATATKATTASSLPSEELPSSAGGPTQSKAETQEGTPKQKRERKPQRPGKYVCTYCGRACAKPSVLQKHIRSHTGERPYPCAPCGFSFKTKSNLYKHRKSHTHRVKAGLALGEPKSIDEHVTESEDETRQLSTASSHTERQSSVVSTKSHETDRSKDCAGGNDDSYAVKKRLALRLSRGKHAPQDSSDEKASTLISGSKGSTESGYFSRSESTEQSQDSPPNTSAKSYAEIILGKYGRLGHLQRIPRHHNQQPSSQEDKSIPFTVPKKQVIDHITKLITINEAVVDTSKIDSVKPRRFSLSRKNSSESQKNSSMKEALIHSPKAGDPGYKNSGSITMGVPCEKFHHASLNVEQPAGQTSAPLVRSHSVPSAASSFDASSGGPSKFRLSQSFDERQPSERQTSRRYGMLKRQPAIEIPLGAELTKEDHEGSCSFYPDSITTVLDHKQPQPYECEACGTGCKDWEGYKKHKQSLCSVHHSRSEVVISQIKCSQLINHAARAGTSAMRKRRKEESFEFDDPSSPSLPSPASFSGQCKDESSVAFEGPRRPTLHTCSVIQHTSSFEKQESLCNEYQGTEATKNSPPHEEYQLVPLKQPQNETAKLTNRKLVRQHNVQVPEILVTEDSNMSTGASKEPTPKTKHSEKHDEFQWPQRSPSLAQLPIEKLPPKKKRLRLAETAQSSGDSSFDSISLPRSPSQDSSASYASSRSTSFEESNRPDMEVATLTPLRKSRAPHMLTVPGVHQHREMRRSASEQAPHDPQPIAQLAETRSKSFDYSCLSPERSAVGWRERRKCLLLRHTAIRDPDEEEEELCAIPSCSPEPVTSSQASPSYVYCSGSPSSPSPGETGLYSPVTLPCKEIFSRWKLSQNIQLTGSSELSLTHCLSADPVKEEALHVQTGQPPPQAPQSYLTHGPSGAARAHYLPMSTGLKLEIPLLHNDYSEVRVSPPHIQLSPPHITSSPELLRPVTSPAVAVRLQTDTLTLACAIYTTLSQSTTPGPKEKLNAVSHNIGIQKAEFRDHRDTSPNLQLWSDDGPRISGSGGNKRMLSPSNSIEILTELQQQQKRVKEEEGEEREVRCVEKTSVETCNEELKQENQSHIPSICSLTTHVGPSFPSLLSSTCNSWCYLNYVKPNPSTLDEQRPSVYSSWSTSGYDPNPPGLSSKTALSLLHCKQRLGPSIYTTSPISARTTESMDQEDHKRPCSTEVYNSQSFCRDNEGRRKGQWSADDNKADQKEEREEEEKEKEAKVQSSSYRVKQPPEAWISERGSNEKYAIEHDGGGRKCQCKDGEFNLKSTSVQQQCTHCIRDDSLPCNCKDCNASFKGKGVYEEPSLHPPKNKARQYTNLERRRHDEDNTRAGSQDEDNRSKAADSSHPSSSDREESQAGRQPVEPEPSQSTMPPRKDSTQKISASTRRGLFAGRHLDASAKASLGGSCSPNAPLLIPQKEPPSPPPRPSSSLSPSSCLVSTFTLRSLSPISPVVAQSCESESSGLPGSLADTSSQRHTCLHSRDWPSTARLSMDEVGVTHVTALAMRPRVAHNLLSHLPLHSQQPSRAPSLLIPIGGIHMIQPRSLLPLYSLVSSPRTATVNPAETSRRLSDALKGRFSLLQHEDTLKETLHHSPASPPDLKSSRGTSKSSQSDVLSHRKSQGCFGIQHTSNPGMETRRPEVNTETERYPETTQGQTKAPSSQTQL